MLLTIALSFGILFSPVVRGDFHIMLDGGCTRSPAVLAEPFPDEPLPEGGCWIACPSDYLTCSCAVDTEDRTGWVNPHDGSPGDVGGFTMMAGLCGMGVMHFYPQSNGSIAYYDAESGTLLGYCYAGGHSLMHCAHSQVAQDDYVCLGYPCNP
jgi:hypothetical protein